MRFLRPTINAPSSAPTGQSDHRKLPSLGTLLAQLGGGDPLILSHVPTARGRFIQMGLVLLSTASLAVVSMSFALVDGLRARWWLAIPLGIGWGFVILNIDRLLIQSIRPGGGFWRTLWILLPRLLVAGLLGLVIATPLVLRVFDSEIEAEMRRTNAAATNEIAETRASSPEAKRLAEVNERIATNEGILAGNLPGLTSPNVQAATERLTRAEADLERKRKIANEAYDAMICELDGRRCRGASGKHGPGPRYQALKRMYEVAAADLANAEQAVASARTALDQVEREAAAANTAQLAEAQERARNELPGLIQERDALQARITAIGRDDSDIQASNTGLLARLEALRSLGDESSAAWLAHMAVAALFFMIELLPVMAKLLTSTGPPSLYDRISELQDKSTLDDAIQRRNHERRRIEGDSRKRWEIEDDMRKREITLGMKANAHVASEMEKILDVALQQWSANLVKALHSAPTLPGSGGIAGLPPANGHPPQPGPAHQPGHAQPGPTQPGQTQLGSAQTNADGQAIRARFNLPPGGRL